jgi:hypothetical protein
MTISLRLATVLAGLVFILAACGGGASPSPSAPASASPPASPSAAPSVEPSPSASEGALPSLPPVDLGAAAEALENVDSYRLRMAIEGATTATVEATVVRQPEVAQDITVTNAQGTQHLVLVGDQAWADVGGTGQFTQLPAAAASSLIQAYDPILLVGSINQPGLVQALTEVGRETKNGVETTHYHLDGSSAAGQFASMPPEAVFDVWVADDGYLVSMNATGVGAQSVQMDITNINDPANVVEAPTP